MAPDRKSVALIGTGFVADFYVRSKELHPEIEIIGAYDIRQDRLKKFCDYWNIKAFKTQQDMLDSLPKEGVVLNLTSPGAHYEVTKTCLEAGYHVYSEKPLATTFEQAQELVELAANRDLMLGGAPCSYLSEAAQIVASAVKSDVCGPVRLVYAELDDGYVPQAPFKKWISESGAPWPYENEMRTGCTLEHAGYVLTWMIAMFGSIKSITAFSAATIDKNLAPKCATPDVSFGIVQFASGPILRLTCTVVAPHNHRLLVTGDKGTIEIGDTWDNYAKVLFRKRFTIRRRLMESPIAKRLRLRLTRPTAGKKASRRGASTMDYFLGPVEMFETLGGSATNQCSPEMALHTTEATLFLQNAGENSTTYQMQTKCDALPLLDWAKTLK